MSTGQRGQCQRCGFRHRLRKDGTIGEHFVYYGHEREYCWGSHKLPMIPPPSYTITEIEGPTQ